MCGVFLCAVAEPEPLNKCLMVKYLESSSFSSGWSLVLNISIRLETLTASVMRVPSEQLLFRDQL